MDKRKKFSLILLAACLTSCSSTYNSTREARLASQIWEGEGKTVTVQIPKSIITTKTVIVRLDEKEYQQKLEMNRKATQDYINTFKPKWKKADEDSKRILLEKYPYLTREKLDYTMYDSYPKEADFYLDIKQRLEPVCTETTTTRCIARRKIRTRLPDRTREIKETKRSEYIESTQKNLRYCFQEVEVETRQYVCKEYHFKRDSKISEEDWNNRKAKYHYFKY